MTTVPATAAATLLAGRPDLRATLADAGRLVGARAEVDVDLARRLLGDDAADLLEAYGSRCEALWEQLETGTGGPSGRSGATWVAVRRPLVTHQQVTGKKGRADLVEVYEALSELPGVAELLEHVTAAAPDVTVLEAICSSLGGRVVTRSEDSVVVEVGLEGRYAYPDLLGGVTWPGEIRRVLTLTTRQAAWRDRRVRRLSQVQVDVDEIWSDPADLKAAVAALPGV